MDANNGEVQGLGGANARVEQKSPGQQGGVAQKDGPHDNQTTKQNQKNIEQGGRGQDPVDEEDDDPGDADADGEPSDGGEDARADTQKSKRESSLDAEIEDFDAMRKLKKDAVRDVQDGDGASLSSGAAVARRREPPVTTAVTPPLLQKLTAHTVATPAVGIVDRSSAPAAGRSSAAPAAGRSSTAAAGSSSAPAVIALDDEISSGESELDLLDDPEKKGKGRAKAKKSKVNIKEEELDPGFVTVASKTQAELDNAFLGFVRINIVDPDPTVEDVWQTVNERDIDNTHKKCIADSLAVRKVDWDHPLHVLISAKNIDPSCLSKSVFPVADLKPLVWTCPPAERRIQYLSGNHRLNAAKDYHGNLEKKKSHLEHQLDVHMKEQAAGGQMQILVGGVLGSELEGQLRAQIGVIGEASAEAKLWTLAVYDDDTATGNTNLISLLATNEARPSKAADAQEKVQMMSWRLFKQIDIWREQHPGQPLPVPGSRIFRNDILSAAVTEMELKEGTANFLFTQADNLALIQDLWQLPYFRVSGKVPLSRLELALGKVGKKDLSKKSGSAMVWRWLIHQLMRDLRLVGTTDRFPDLDHDDDDRSRIFRNYEAVLLGANSVMQITDELWHGAGYSTEEERAQISAQKSVAQYARVHAHAFYLNQENDLVEFHKLSIKVWQPSVLAIVDDIYEEEFRVTGANKKFGNFNSREWTDAMVRYRDSTRELLPPEWERRLKGLKKSEHDRKDALALRQAKAKLQWLHILQTNGGRLLNTPLLSFKFVEDLSEALLDAEGGFKLLARTLDPPLQIGLLRIAPSDDDESRVVYNDYLSYLVAFLSDSVRFKFTSTAEIEDELSAWLLANLPLITACGKDYQDNYLGTPHDSFLAISMNQLTTDLAKVHPKDKKGLAVAPKFPALLEKTFPDVEFDKKDCDAVFEIYKILSTTAARYSETQGAGGAGSSANLTSKEQAAMKAAKEDIMGRFLPSLSLSHVAKYPALAMLYRHALPWQNPEAGAKTGKANGFLAYAYMLYVGWRVYGDTIGRMTKKSTDYKALRQSLFAFLGSHCYPKIDDYMGPSGRRPPATRFANWDHKLLDSFVDLRGRSIDDMSGGVHYSPPSVKLFDSSRMSKHAANIKKSIDGMGRSSLALGPALDSSKVTTTLQRNGPWSPDVVMAARAYAIASIRNALKAEHQNVNKDMPDVAYVEVPEEDLEHLLPPLPQVAEEPPNHFTSLDDFAMRDPKRYRLYCYGLVAEGYEQPRGPDGGGSSTTSSIHRQSWRKSGDVYPQDLNWLAAWAQVDVNSLDPRTLPDPIATLKVPRARDGPLPSAVVSAQAPSSPSTSSGKGKQVEQRTKNTVHDHPPAPESTTATASAVAAPTGLPKYFNAMPRGVRPRFQKAGASPSVPSPIVPSPSDASQAGPDNMDVDPPSAPEPAAPRSQETLGNALVPPFSSPLTPLPTQYMQADSDRPRLPPATSPRAVVFEGPTSDPTPQPPAMHHEVYATVTLELDDPTDPEVAEFSVLADACDGEVFGRVIHGAVETVLADPTFAVDEGLTPERYEALRHKFWAIIRDEKRESVPDEVFSYIRLDHPDVDHVLNWNDFLQQHKEDGVGWRYLETVADRYRQRSCKDLAPVLDVIPGAALAGADVIPNISERTQVTPVSAQQGNTFMLLWDNIRQSNFRAALAQQAHRKRERSQSIVDDTRDAGGSSPPKQRSKRRSENDSDQGASSMDEDQQDDHMDDATSSTAGGGASTSTAIHPHRTRSSTMNKRRPAQAGPTKKGKTTGLDAVREEDDEEQSAASRDARTGGADAGGARKHGRRLIGMRP